MFADLRYSKDAAERAKQYAKDCEDRAREWSDLRAQWQNSRAAINVANIADGQLWLTVLEIVLLIITVVGGIVSLLFSRAALIDKEKERADQERQFGSQLDTAYRGMAELRRIAEQQTRAYVLPVHASFQWPKDGDPEFSITYRNAGQTPAINVSECILFDSDTLPPPYDHSRVFAEKPIVGGDTLSATTVIPLTLRPSLKKSRKIGKLLAEGGDVWVYVYYQDVFGSTFRTGAQVTSKLPFKEGMSDEDMAIHFAGEACGFFEEIKLDAYGRAVDGAGPDGPQLTPTNLDKDWQ